MKRRINSTGRIRLPVEAITVRLSEPAAAGLPRSFAATLNLPASLQEKSGAAVYVEPYVKSSTMRFSYGTVGAIVPPPSTLLTDLDPGPVLFRLKVVDETPGVGRILAAAERIRPQDEMQDGDSRKSLLPLGQRDLGEQIWTLDLKGGARPVLFINNRVPAIRERLMTDPIVQGAVFPHAVRQVFDAILTDDEVDDDAEWVQDWLKFGSELLGRDVPTDIDADEEAEEIERLLDEIVEKFSGARTFARKAREKEESAE